MNKEISIQILSAILPGEARTSRHLTIWKTGILNFIKKSLEKPAPGSSQGNASNMNKEK